MISWIDMGHSSVFSPFFRSWNWMITPYTTHRNYFPSTMSLKTSRYTHLTNWWSSQPKFSCGRNWTWSDSSASRHFLILGTVLSQQGYSFVSVAAYIFLNLLPCGDTISLCIGNGNTPESSKNFFGDAEFKELFVWLHWIIVRRIKTPHKSLRPNHIVKWKTNEKEETNKS